MHHRFLLAVVCAVALLGLPRCLLTIDESRITGSATGVGGGAAGGGGAGACGGASASGEARIFFSDLESGPNVGGENDLGAYVTIVGRGFGEMQGCSFVTIGGGEAVKDYPVWSDRKITFQLGELATTGDIVVHVGAATPSNGVPFTVRPGSIYFAADNGDDNAAGTVDGPFASVLRCRDALTPGGICYLRDGLEQKNPDPAQPTYEAALALTSAGEPGLPKALVAYPEDPEGTVTIGDAGLDRAVFIESPHWVLAGLNLVGQEVLDLRSSAPYIRVVNNRVTCGYRDTDPGCVNADSAHDVELLGNEVTSDGMINAPMSFVHAINVYDAYAIDIGWNWIHDTGNDCVAIDLSVSQNSPDESAVHDNLIHDVRCDGIQLDTGMTTDTIRVFNNLLYDVGEGPDYFGWGSFTCIVVTGMSTVDVRHNTLHGCSAADPTGSSLLNTGNAVSTMQLRNNIVRVVGMPYYFYSFNGSQVTGENNLLFGSPQGEPIELTGSIMQDPAFVDAMQRDFHLQTSSPARDAGVATGLGWDLDGRLRDDGIPDIGAYEVPTP